MCIICGSSKAISWDQCDITWHFASNKYFFFKVAVDVFYFVQYLLWVYRKKWGFHSEEHLDTWEIWISWMFCSVSEIWISWMYSSLEIVLSLSLFFFWIDWLIMKVVGVDDTRCQERSVKGTWTLNFYDQ